jgi:hypothetical protein
MTRDLTRDRRRTDRLPVRRPDMRAARLLNAAAAILAAGVATDSATEHYRAGFHNRVMFIAPVVSSMALATAIAAAADPHRGGTPRRAVFTVSVLTGVAGLAFHVINVSKRPGGWNSTSVFYGAPMAAPLGLTMAGGLGLAASRVARTPEQIRGRILGGLSAVGLLGTSVEAAALHFRGAFQNPFMYAPVTLPPIAAAAVAAASLTPSPHVRGFARMLLRLTSVLGVAGTAFHAWGIHRRMGGWGNWTQNVLAGPPLPAPPAFTGLALAGLAAVGMLDSDRRP